MDFLRDVAMFRRNYRSVMTVFALFLSLQVLLAVFSIELLASVRVYVNGESLYSNGQKAAHLALLDYIDSRKERDYALFLEAISIPVGDRIAREELQKPEPDVAVARHALLNGGTHPDDVGRAIRLFLWFHENPPMTRIIEIWTEGDAVIKELVELAESAHRNPERDAPAMLMLREKAPILNRRITELERTFTTEVGLAARTVEGFLLKANVAAAVLLAILGFRFISTTARHQARVEQERRQADARVAEERRKAFDEQRQTVAKMEAVVAEKAIFLSATSHELRSPLQSIVSAVDTLQKRYDRVAVNEVNVLRRAVKAMNVLLEDLLTLAKGDAGRMVITPEPFDPIDLINDIADEFREAAETKGLTLEINAPLEPQIVVADPARIGQILTNLVSNAVKYTMKGRVVISLDEGHPQEGVITLSVLDTGPGIPDEFLSKMYEPFSRLPAASSQAGSGIGLAVVRALVNHLGGEIAVNTTLGVGTEFRVRIRASRYVEATLADHSPQRLLIVDDRSDVLELLSGVARDLGYHADKADSAGVALSLVAAEKYDAILIDLDMPFMTGEQLAQRIRSDESRNCSSKLIAISAATRVREIGSAAPFDGFLRKPFGASALQYTLGHATTVTAAS